MGERILRVPQGLASPANDQRILNLNGFSVIKSYTFTQERKGTLFLEDHLLLFVQHGIYSVSYGGEIYTVHKNEMVLLKKAISIQYQKTEDPNDPCLLEYKMFFLKDDLLREFFKMANIKPKGPEAPVPISVKPVNELLAKYVESVEPYFKKPEEVDGNLIKIKLLELLYDLAATDENLMQQLMQLKQQARSDIPKIVEENILNPVSLNDLAYLSGRSLSSFKRDFQAIYNMSPYHWLRERRLERAKELLMNTSISVTDICFMTGFENTAHFSRAFKERYGSSPVSYKQ
ncbi:helix-turn-helix domain-containing protein [Anaerocolumna xylanovorans]|uniref:Helix-turn-helix domain-containing protein n=1 Tax=Anaerocolumna xylanovorans DSM 12503 TaxID=1121345 RepID=A0A1M7YI40_9FIRM|nr:AraC family transcriptional regulator [Anaerocolumna xylanovorans]SHO52290.1 Helix-turn-helix domain-containing protein [Anaerocolumna xylanovorans DSM 12503]